MQNDVL